MFQIQKRRSILKIRLIDELELTFAIWKTNSIKIGLNLRFTFHPYTNFFDLAFQKFQSEEWYIFHDKFDLFPIKSHNFNAMSLCY